MGGKDRERKGGGCMGERRTAFCVQRDSERIEGEEGREEEKVERKGRRGEGREGGRRREGRGGEGKV